MKEGENVEKVGWVHQFLRLPNRNSNQSIDFWLY